MTKKELMAEAVELGLKVNSKMSVKEIEDIIDANVTNSDDEPIQTVEVPVINDNADISEEIKSSTTVISLETAETEFTAKLTSVNKTFKSLTGENTAEDEKKMITVLVALSKALDELNTQQRVAAYNEILAEYNAVVAACERGEIMLTSIKKPTAKVKEYTTDTKSEIIDISILNEYAVTVSGSNGNYKGIFKSDNADKLINPLNCLILAWTAEDENAEVSDKLKALNLTDAAENLLECKLESLSEAGDFIDVTQRVVSAMADDITLDRKKVSKWIGRYVSYSRNKANTVNAKQGGQFRQYLMHLLYATVTGKALIIE